MSLCFNLKKRASETFFSSSMIYDAVTIWPRDYPAANPFVPHAISLEREIDERPSICIFLLPLLRTDVTLSASNERVSLFHLYHSQRHAVVTNGKARMPVD